MRTCGTFRTDYGRDMAFIQSKTQWCLLIAFLVLVCLLPFLLDASWLSFLNFTLITIIAVLGLNIVTGMAGQFNMGQAAFVLAGGYAAAILVMKGGLPFWATLPLSPLIAGIIGILLGFSSLRLMGFYLAIATYAFHEVVVYLIRHGGSLTGGVLGINRVPALSLGGFAFDTNTRMFYLVLLIVVMAVFFSVNLGRSRVGRAFEGIKQNWMAAKSIGVNIFHYKLLAFLIGSALAGLAGCLLVSYQGFASYEMVTVWDSIWYLGMMIIGGWGSVLGVIMGVLTLSVVKQLMVLYSPAITTAVPFLSFGRIAPLTTIIFGLVVILFVSFQPNGLAYFWNRFKTYYRRWPF
jgi:branched-chain amino acid transport system permease protein